MQSDPVVWTFVSWIKDVVIKIASHVLYFSLGEVHANFKFRNASNGGRCFSSVFVKMIVQDDDAKIPHFSIGIGIVEWITDPSSTVRAKTVPKGVVVRDRETSPVAE